MPDLTGLFPRRGFLTRLGLLLSGGYLLTLKASLIPLPRPRPQGGKFLNGFEMAMCAAACERVLPRDQDPGAIDLGVPQFIDGLLYRQRAALELGSGNERLTGRGFLQGLYALNKWAFEKEQRTFLELSPQRRDAMLRSFEQEGGSKGHRFIRELAMLTIEGAMADPSYGGNKDHGGWELIGFDVPCPRPGCD